MNKLNLNMCDLPEFLQNNVGVLSKEMLVDIWDALNAQWSAGYDRGNRGFDDFDDE